MRGAHTDTSQALTCVASAGGGSAPPADVAMITAENGARCYRCPPPTKAELWSGRKRVSVDVETMEVRDVMDCPSQRRWLQRSAFRAVRHLKGGGTGNRCNTAPMESHVIDATPRQEVFKW